MLIKKAVQFLLKAFIDEVTRRKVKATGLRAVHSYISLVRRLRHGALAGVAIVGVVCLFLLGNLMLLTGILWMAKIPIEQVPFLLVALGLVLTLGSFFILYGIFDQRRWLEVSRAYELMDLVLGQETPAVSGRSMPSGPPQRRGSMTADVSNDLRILSDSPRSTEHGAG